MKFIQEIKLEPVGGCNFLRMAEEEYKTVLSLVTPSIEKQNICMHQTIFPHEKVTATLRFLTPVSRGPHLHTHARTSLNRTLARMKKSSSVRLTEADMRRPVQAALSTHVQFGLNRLIWFRRT